MRTARQAHGSNRRRPARVSCPSAGQGLLAARHARAHRPVLHTLVIDLRCEQIRADVVSVSDLKPVTLRRIAEHNLVFTRSDGRPLVPRQDRISRNCSKKPGSTTAASTTAAPHHRHDPERTRGGHADHHGDPPAHPDQSGPQLREGQITPLQDAMRRMGDHFMPDQKRPTETKTESTDSLAACARRPLR
jgi:hypothetical protein